MNFQEPIGGLVERIARALERLAPAPPRKPDFDRAQAFVWQAEPEAFLAVANVNRVPLPLLKGIDGMRDVLFDNTVRFARGFPPTMPCSGARAGWAKARWSRPCMPP
jgi:predicted AAA+ superfamily ATPase